MDISANVNSDYRSRGQVGKKLLVVGFWYFVERQNPYCVRVSIFFWYFDLV
jgi:hypothetical protein